MVSIGAFSNNTVLIVTCLIATLLDGVDDGPTRMRRGHGDIAHKFNYTAVEFSAESVFRAHDVDHSGTIDGTELEQVRGTPFAVA